MPPANAVAAFRDLLSQSPALMKSIPSLVGKGLVCHCAAGTPCHADALLVQIEAFRLNVSQMPRPLRPGLSEPIVQTLYSFQWPESRRPLTPGKGLCIGLSMGKEGPFLRTPPEHLREIPRLLALLASDFFCPRPPFAFTSVQLN